MGKITVRKITTGKHTGHYGVYEDGKIITGRNGHIAYQTRAEALVKAKNRRATLKKLAKEGVDAKKYYKSFRKK